MFFWNSLAFSKIQRMFKEAPPLSWEPRVSPLRAEGLQSQGSRPASRPQPQAGPARNRCSTPCHLPAHPPPSPPTRPVPGSGALLAQGLPHSMSGRPCPPDFPPPPTAVWRLLVRESWPASLPPVLTSCPEAPAKSWQNIQQLEVSSRDESLWAQEGSFPIIESRPGEGPQDCTPLGHQV